MDTDKGGHPSDPIRSPGTSSIPRYFFLNVVLNLAFGVLLGDPWPSAQETLGALVILLSIAVSAREDAKGKS